jgi:CHAT domain-containing protein
MLIMMALGCLEKEPEGVENPDPPIAQCRGDLLYAEGLIFLDRQQYDSALHCFEQSMRCFLAEDDRAGRFRSQLRIGDVYRQQGVVSVADSILVLAQAALQENNGMYPLLESEFLHFKGALQRMKGFSDSARLSYQQSISIRGVLGIEDTLAIPTLVNMGNLCYSEKDYEGAESLYVLADSIAGFKKVYDRTYGVLLQNAALAYSATGEFDLSDICFQKAVAVFRGILAEGDIQLAVCMNLYAGSLIRRGEHQKALGKLLEARSIHALKDRPPGNLMAEIHTNTGLIYLDALGDWELAADHFRLALQYIEKSPVLWLPQQTDAVKYGLAKALMESGDLDSSAGILAGMLEEGVQYTTQDIKVRILLSEVYRRREQFGKAEMVYLQHLQQTTGSGIVGRKAQLQVLKHLGMFYLHQGRFGDAVDVFQRIPGLLRMDTLLQRHELVIVYGGLGYSLVETSDYRNAVSVLSRAIPLNMAEQQTASGLDPLALYGTYQLHNGMVLHYTLARAYFALARGGDDGAFWGKALRAIESAVVYQDKLLLRQADRNEEQVIRIREDLDIHSLALEIIWHGREHLDQMRLDELVYKYQESAKGTSLKRMMMEEQVMRMHEVPDTLLRELRHWRNALAHYERLIYEEGRFAQYGPDLEKHWEEKVLECRGRLGDINARIASSMPGYDRFLQRLKSIPLDQVRKMLKPDEAILTYSMLGDSAIMVLRIDHAGAVAKRINLPEHFNDLVLRYRRELADPALAGQKRGDILRFQDLSHQLFNLLVAPAGPLDGIRFLTVVPEGLISFIPFETLIKNPDQGLNSYRDPDYLLRHHTIAYAYSLNLLLASDFQPRKRLQVAAFAPDYGTRDDVAGKAAVSVYKPLPGAREEITAIRKQVVGTRTYFGKGAAESSFREEAAKGVVMHLAMHAQVNPDYPMFSSFVFADDDSPGDDHLLNGYEIFQMEIRSPMVVMSACNSGFGPARGREGLLNLGRGFLKAGVPAVVMSHWNFDDRAGSVMMPVFYRFLESGDPSGVALQQAKLEFLQQADGLRSHPYFWSAPVLYGYSGPLTTGANWLFLIYAGIGGVLLFLLMIYFYRRRA